jgi:purine nucleosidase
VLIHLDTDLGGDPDDACALALLLGSPGVEIAGITTTIDPGGERAGMVRYCLSLVGREEIPVVAGARASMTSGQLVGPYQGEEYWPERFPSQTAAEAAASDLLARSIAQGTTVIAIGPYTNLARLELERPGTLRGADVVVMGGWIGWPEAGLPSWGPERDWNVQWDTTAARVLAEAGTQLTLVTLPATLKAQLHRRDLPRLAASGPLGALLARQSEAHARDSGKAALATQNQGLPSDFLNFHYDPVTCAVAMGWDKAVAQEMSLATHLEEGLFTWRPDPGGCLGRVVTDLDGPAFTDFWLERVEAAQLGSRRRGGPAGRGDEILTDPEQIR